MLVKFAGGVVQFGDPVLKGGNQGLGRSQQGPQLIGLALGQQNFRGTVAAQAVGQLVPVQHLQVKLAGGVVQGRQSNLVPVQNDRR